MATKRDNLEDDDDGGFGSVVDTEDDISSVLRASLPDAKDDDDDGTGGFDAPLDEPKEKSTTVDEDEGTQRIQKARDGDTRIKQEKIPEEVSGEEKGGKESAKDGAPIAKDAPAKAEETPAAISDDDYAAQIEALPPALKSRVAADVGALKEFTGLFRGRETMLNGASPRDATKWLIDVYDYAGRDPGAYAAWVLKEASGGDAAKIENALKKAAEAHGFRIEKAGADAADDDDDPFMSESERALREENKALKAAAAQAAKAREAAQYGPDSPQEKNRRVVADVISEVGPDGNPVRPHFDKLMSFITQIVQENAAAGRAMDRESLIEAYEAAELAHPATAAEARARLLAAQAPASVRKDGQQDAAALAKAKAASSKIIDGPSQSAGRRPAEQYDASMSIEDYLRKIMP